MGNNFIEKIQYIYIKKIKRYMVCPACGDKLRINKKGNLWKCDKCDYKLSHKKIEKGYIFCFCDKCDTFLNNQEEFNYNNKKFCCTKCGHKNDITIENTKKICKDCGVVLTQDSKYGLCSKCLKIRTEKWNGRFKTGLKIIGGLAAAAGFAYLVASTIDDTEYSNDEIEIDEDSYPHCKTCGAEMTNFDGYAWYTCPECEDKVRIIDGIETWYDEIFKRGGKHHKSDFELADFCRGGDLAED